MNPTQAVQRIADLKASVKSATEEIEDLFTLLDEQGFDQVRSYAFDKYILKVEPNKRFDGATAKRNLSEFEYELILKPTPNAALAKELLGDDEYHLVQKDYGVRRSVVRVDDLDI